MAPAVSPLFRAGNNAFDEAAAAEAAADVGKLFEGSKEELQQRWGGSAVVFPGMYISIDKHTRNSPYHALAHTTTPHPHPSPIVEASVAHAYEKGSHRDRRHRSSVMGRGPAYASPQRPKPPASITFPPPCTATPTSSSRHMQP